MACVSRLLKNLSQQPEGPGQGWPDEIKRSQALDLGSAAKTTLFESDVEKAGKAFFNILLGPVNTNIL
jgi:hypothetical protein